MLRKANTLAILNFYVNYTSLLLPLAPKQKEKPFVEDDGDLSSVSDAGSLDSIDSDDDGPKDEEILFGEPSLKGIGEHRSMHDAMAELRDHFGDAYDEEEEEGERKLLETV